MKIYATVYEIPDVNAGGRFVVQWHQRMYGGLSPAYTFPTYDDAISALSMAAKASCVFNGETGDDHLVVVHDFMHHIDEDLGRRPRVAYLVQANYKTTEAVQWAQ